MFKIHGHPMSTCTKRVGVSLRQMGLVEGKDFEMITHDFSEIKTPEWLTKQPFGQVPYLEDESTGITMYESRAMVRYIAGRIKSPMIVTPADKPSDYAKFETAASVETANFDEHAHTIVGQLVFAPRYGRPTNNDIVKTHVEGLEKRLPVLDKILSERKYMAGDKITIVDLFHLPYGSMLAQTGAVASFTDGTYPNFKRWWDEITALESWKETLKV